MLTAAEVSLHVALLEDRAWKYMYIYAYADSVCVCSFGGFQSVVLSTATPAPSRNLLKCNYGAPLQTY